MIREEYLEMVAHLAFDYEVQMAKLAPDESGYFTIPSLKNALKWAKEFLATAGIDEPPKCMACEDTGYHGGRKKDERVPCAQCDAYKE